MASDVMKGVLPKICAAWFVVSIVLPWTAPFPTCDLTDLFGMHSHQRAPLTDPSSPANASADSDYTIVSPLVTREGHLKLVVVSALNFRAAVKVLQPGVVPLPADSCGSTCLPCQHSVLRI
jgi:hypothetical protein